MQARGLVAVAAGIIDKARADLSKWEENSNNGVEEGGLDYDGFENAGRLKKLPRFALLLTCS